MDTSVLKCKYRSALLSTLCYRMKMTLLLNKGVLPSFLYAQFSSGNGIFLKEQKRHKHPVDDTQSYHEKARQKPKEQLIQSILIFFFHFAWRKVFYKAVETYIELLLELRYTISKSTDFVDIIQEIEMNNFVVDFHPKKRG